MVLIFFPHVGDVEQIYTRNSPSDKPLFLQKAPSGKSTPPSPPIFHQMMLLKNISSLILVIIFTYNCMFCFSILVSVGSQKCSLVWCTSKRGVACNPMLHSRHLYFVLVSLFLVEHTHSTEFSRGWGLSSSSCSLRSRYPSRLLY